MFRKQKCKDHLLIIGEYKPLKNCQERIKLVKITENENKKNRGLGLSNLHRVCSQDHSLAVIDSNMSFDQENEDAWIVGEPFKTPVNVSELIRKKATRVFLGEKQMILQSKNEYFLVNWGSIKTLDRDLMKISTFNTSQYDDLFMAYRITSAQEGAFFYYSLQKKVENSNRLFQVRNATKEIIGHPTMNKMRVGRVVKGISVGKHHSLLWDNQGKLYSWGCRSLALGYGHLPSQDLIESPRQVEIGKYTLMAFAATHYSLALTSEGSIYEWGMQVLPQLRKMQFNEINEQPIFKPRELDFRFFNCTAKFVSLKGRDNNFAALSSTNQLYVWGLNAKQLLSPSIILPSSWQGSYIYEPVLQTDLLGCKIIDFTIEMQYIGVILGNEEALELPQEEYWERLKEKAKFQLVAFKANANRIKTQCCEDLSTLRKKYKNPMLSDLASERKQTTIQADRKPIKIRTMHRQKHASMESFKLNPFKKTAPALTATCWPALNKSNSNHKRQVSDCFGYNSPIFQTPLDSQKEKANLRCSETGQSSTYNSQARRETRMGMDKKFSQTYNMRLQGVLEKKKKLEIMSLTTNLRRIDERDIQYRQRRKEEEEAYRKKMEDTVTLQQSLMPFLIKRFLANLLTSPLEEARVCKQGVLKRLVTLNKAQTNIKLLFSDIKAKHSIQDSQKDKCPRYALLALYFKNYVMKFRARRRQALKKTVVAAMVSSILKEKIRVGLAKLTPKIKKLGKLREWLHSFNTERIKILRELWNNYIIASFKTIDGGMINLHNFSVEATFSQKFASAVQARTIGTLQQYYRGVIKRPQRKILNKKSLGEIKRRANAKFIEQFKEKLSNLEILPYSLHYNTFKRPKNLEITLSQAIKTSPGWVEIQRKVLLDLFTSLLRKSDRDFIERQRQYQLQLAEFLRANYDTFYEMRWKYIIEYNKVERTMQKRRRQKHLRRLLALVGMQKLFDEDCIPQKNLVLEEALRRRDVPRAPSSVLEFDFSHFQVTFKLYWDAILLKSKQLRKKNL